MKHILTIILCVCLLQAKAQWVEQLYAGKTLMDVNFQTPQVGRCFKLNGTGYYGTTDGGTTWSTYSVQLLGIQSPDLDCGGGRNLTFVTDKLVFLDICGSAAKSTDGGKSFTSNPKSIAGYISSINFVDSNFIYLADFGNAWITRDQGKKWTKNYVGLEEMFSSISFADILTGYMVSYKGNIRKTIDGGKTWRAANSGTDKKLSVVKFISPTTGWVAGDGGYLAKTTDGGNSFIQQITGANINFNALEILDSLNGYAAGSLGAVYRTQDGGKKWVKMQTNTFEELYDISCPAKDVCYAVGTGGTIIKFNGALPTSTASAEITAICTIYPNPATSELTVNLQHHQTAQLRIVLQNMLGNEEMVILDEQTTQITKTVPISNLSKGIYTAVIYQNGIRVQTQKIAVQ